MNEGVKKAKENQLYGEDILRICIIATVVIVAILGTWIFVSKKYIEPINPEIEYKEISNNNTYTYYIKDKLINFYDKNKNLVATYTCNSNCEIVTLEENNYKFNSDSLIYIFDNSKYIVYNISLQSINSYFDAIPITAGNYGVVSKRGYYGLINKNCGMMLDLEYKSINYLNGYFIISTENNISIYNNNIILLNNEPMPIENNTTINSAFENNIITINVKNNNLEYKYLFNVVNKTIEKVV